MGSVSRTLPVAAKYMWGALIAYVVMAGIVMATHTSSSQDEIVSDGLLWPLFFFGFIWDYVVNFYGGMFG